MSTGVRIAEVLVFVHNVVFFQDGWWLSTHPSRVFCWFQQFGFLSLFKFIAADTCILSLFSHCCPQVKYNVKCLLFKSKSTILWSPTIRIKPGVTLGRILGLYLYLNFIADLPVTEDYNRYLLWRYSNLSCWHQSIKSLEKLHLLQDWFKQWEIQVNTETYIHCETWWSYPNSPWILPSYLQMQKLNIWDCIWAKS